MLYLLAGSQTRKPVYPIAAANSRAGRKNSGSNTLVAITWQRRNQPDLIQTVIGDRRVECAEMVP